MEFEIPYDLINQIQILLHNEANLASYDPDDPSIPYLPSLEDSISELDPSPPHLRCKHCKGKLIRDLHSVVCVFCCKEVKKEVPPEPINFRSTCGYRWFLESLNLDGSEMVRPPAEEKRSTRGPGKLKGEISLSNLLDLEIKWTSEPEKIGVAVTDESFVQNKSSLNLAGVDLGNFFSEPKGDTASTESDEKFVLNKQVDKTESYAFPGHENLSLFENVPSSETAVTPTNAKRGDNATNTKAVDYTQDPPDTSWTQTIIDHLSPSAEQTSDINMFSSTNNLQEIDFDSFSQSDIFSGLSSNQKDSAEGNKLHGEASVSHRIADRNAKDGGKTEEVLENDVSVATSKSKVDDAEILLSQTPDLSFMLESNLSIPPKS